VNPNAGLPPKKSTSLRIRKYCKQFNKAQGQQFSGESLAVEAFWQSRFYDFNVYSHGKKMEELNYMHANPVIRRLVEHPKDWQWSSLSVYRKGETGLIRIDVE